MPLDRTGGYRACKPAASAREYAQKRRYGTRSNGAGTALPPVVDLRKWCSAVEDQGNLSSCTANGVVGIYEYTGNRLYGGGYKDLSRLFVYW